MTLQTAGIHHITAFAGDPQANVDFYAGVLGLRLVKKTINFDAPDVYHLYFGDEQGSPGTIITFFPSAGSPQGKIGGGQVGITSYVIPPGTIGFWQDRLERYNIEVTNSKTVKACGLSLLNGKKVLPAHGSMKAFRQTKQLKASAVLYYSV